MDFEVLNSHGMLIGTKHTYNDWGLVPSSRPTVGTPEFDRSYLSLPASDFDKEITGMFQTGRLHYSYISFEQEFLVTDQSTDWLEQYKEIKSYLHGKKFSTYFDNDLNHYYVGRWAVGEWSTGDNYSSISLNCEFEPFAYDATESSITDCTVLSTDIDTPVRIEILCTNTSGLSSTQLGLTGLWYDMYNPGTNELDLSLTMSLNDTLIFDGETKEIKYRYANQTYNDDHAEIFGMINSMRCFPHITVTDDLPLKIRVGSSQSWADTLSSGGITVTGYYRGRSL